MVVKAILSVSYSLTDWEQDHLRLLQKFQISILTRNAATIFIVLVTAIFPVPNCRIINQYHDKEIVVIGT